MCIFVGVVDGSLVVLTLLGVPRPGWGFARNNVWEASTPPHRSYHFVVWLVGEMHGTLEFNYSSLG